MKYKYHLNKAQENIFDFAIYFSYVLIVLSSLGLSTLAPLYLETLDYYIRIYICLFLIVRFNPLRKVTRFTELDSKIAFTAGFFILTTTALNQYLSNIKDKVKEKVNTKIKKYEHDKEETIAV
jgi:hypothetical protein